MFYHFVIECDDEWLTTDDTTAEMAAMEGAAVFLDMEQYEIEPLLEYYESFEEVPVK